MQGRQKKGITTILATTFAVTVIVLGLAVMTSSLLQQNNLGQVVTQRNSGEIEKLNEGIELRDGWIDNKKLNMTVVNTGTLPVKLVKMWVTNTTATNGWHQSYILDKVISPADFWKGMGLDLPLTPSNASSYRINVVTERGSSANFMMFSAKDRAVQMSLFASPRSIPTGQDLILVFGVTNNSTDGTMLHSLTPKLTITKVEAPSGTLTATATLVSGATPTIEQSLAPAETVLFKWIYKIAGDVGDRIDFNATLANAKQGNYVTESATVVIDSFAGQSNLSLQALESGVQPNFLVKKGSFAKCTTTPTCSQTVTGVGFQPKTVIFFWTRQNAEGLGSGIYTGYGFASGPSNERAIAIASDDNQGTSDTGRWQSQTRSIIILSDGAPTRSAEADLTSFNADGFTLNWTTNENRADIVHYIALGGTDLTNAFAGSDTLTGSAGSESITGTGFKPDFLMFLSIDETELDDPGATVAKASIGFASSPTNEAGVTVTLRDGQDVSDTYVRQRTAESLIEIRDDGLEDMLAHVTSFDSNGFTISKSSADATVIHYLALKGGVYKVGNFNKSTSTAPASQSVTGVGFKPSGLILTSKNLVLDSNIVSEGRISFGASDGTTEGATWFHDDDGLGTTDTNQRTSTNKIAVHSFGSQATPNAEADLTSFNADGFTLNWTPNNAIAEEIIYAAFTNATAPTILYSQPMVDVEINMTNTGSDTIWVDKNSRVIFNSTSTGNVYAGLVKRWTNMTSSQWGLINSTQHSDAWEPGKTLKFHFSEPKVIPGNPGSGNSVKSATGQYLVYIRISGYDEAGKFVIKPIFVGTAQVT